MILSGRAIQKHIGSDIIIEPYDPKRVNPNSYNLRCITSCWCIPAIRWI